MIEIGRREEREIKREKVRKEEGERKIEIEGGVRGSRGQEKMRQKVRENKWGERREKDEIESECKKNGRGKVKENRWRKVSEIK